MYKKGTISLLEKRKHPRNEAERVLRQQDRIARGVRKAEGIKGGWRKERPQDEERRLRRLQQSGDSKKGKRWTAKQYRRSSADWKPDKPSAFFTSRGATDDRVVDGKPLSYWNQKSKTKQRKLDIKNKRSRPPKKGQDGFKKFRQDDRAGFRISTRTKT